MTDPADRAAAPLQDFLQSREFYELMQVYRHVPLTAHPVHVVEAFENVKSAILAALRPLLDQNGERRESLIRLANEWLAVGGFWNADMMPAAKTANMVCDLRDYIVALRPLQERADTK